MAGQDDCRLDREQLAGWTIVPEEAPATSSRIWTTWITDVDGPDHAEHAVADEELTGRLGRYTAVCGSVVHPAPMAAPPGWRCMRCVMFLRARVRRHRPRRHGHGYRRYGLARALGWSRG